MANVPISNFTVPTNTVGIGATGYSLTGSASASFMDVSGTWNTSGTPTAIKLNITNTASPSGSFLMDLQLSSASQFAVRRYTSGPYIVLDGNRGWIGAKDVGGTNVLVFSGATSGTDTAALSGTNFFVNSTIGIGFSSGAVASAPTADTILTRRAAANLRLGAADAATPVAQTLSVQGRTGTDAAATAYPFTIQGAQGTGTGAGGSIVFQVAPAGSSGTAQNALATAVEITSAGVFKTASLNTLGAFYLQVQPAIQNAGNFATGTDGALGSNGGAFVLGANKELCWSNTANNPVVTVDLRLTRDAANTLALRNSTAAQTFNIYNTFTSITNYERLRIFAQSGGNVIIGTEKGSGGGTARGLEFQTDGTTRLTISTTAITNSSSTPFTSPNIAGELQWPGSGSLTFTGDGLATLRGWGASFGLLRFGGTTSSFPALKRDSTTLQVRLADDSAFATIQGKLRADVNAVAETPTATHTITITDAAGTAYKVLCVAA